MKTFCGDGMEVAWGLVRMEVKLNGTEVKSLWTVDAGRGGAVVLKVGGGTNSASESSRKFFDPHFLACGGKILLKYI